MRLTQADYDERKQRQNDGVASDDDRRLIKLYEGEGYVQSRLKREAAAKAAGREARGDLDEPDLDEDGDQVDGDGVNFSRRHNHAALVAFANKINAQLAEDERPIADPAGATRKDLIAAYQNYATD